MAAYTDIVATVGGATSNSYVKGIDADQFAALQSWEAVWLGKTESERTIALLQAAKWLDTIDFGAPAAVLLQTVQRCLKGVHGPVQALAVMA